VRNTPALNHIFNLLESLALGGPKSLQALAREARLVITARLASTSSNGEPRDKKVQNEESPQEIYQKALKLLQDPILPVRAHGLLLLRQLVTTKPGSGGSGKEPDINRALVPAILSIFRQSLQDEDSYIFLNAVQGLSAMVETYGKEVLMALMSDYSEGLEGLGAKALTHTQVDVRVRIGEALGQVIRRCGSALGLYGEVLQIRADDHLLKPLSRIIVSTPIRGESYAALPCPASRISSITTSALRKHIYSCDHSLRARLSRGYGGPFTTGEWCSIWQHKHG
jgi:hypothetical protein